MIFNGDLKPFTIFFRTGSRKSVIVCIKVFPVVSLPSQNKQGEESMKS